MTKETLEQRSVARCCDEMGRAILFLRALRGVVKGETAHGIDFIRLAMFALEDQMHAHIIKVLDGREQAGFWYLYKKHEKACFDDITSIEKNSSTSGTGRTSTSIGKACATRRRSGKRQISRSALLIGR
jgi:hypothetical protein